MRLFSMAAVTLGLFAVGCGGGGSKTPSSGSNTPTNPTYIQTATPANGAKSVAIDKPITVVFNQAIDPASINADISFQVLPVMSSMAGMGMRMGVEDNVEQIMERLVGVRDFNVAARQLQFTPAEHLENGMTYRVVFSGLKTAAGAALPTATITFSTLVNPRTQRVTYSAPGVVDRVHIYEIDPLTSMMKQMLSYTGSVAPANLVSRTVMMGAAIPGPGGLPVSEVEYTVAAGVETIKSYNAPIIEGGVIVAFGNYTSPGQDGIWNQTDDLLSGYFEMVEEHGTHFVMSRFSANNNTPARWSDRTTAFTSRGVELTERDAMGRSLGQYVYSSLGADGVIDFDANGKPAPQPGNDVLIQYTKIERNAAGQRVMSFRFGQRASRDGTRQAVSPLGSDGILFTADDPITELEVTTRDNMGHETLEVEYDRPGAITPPSLTGTRADWESIADNRAADYTVTEYSSNGVRTLEKEYDAGLDGIKGSADDILEEETTFDPLL